MNSILMKYLNGETTTSGGPLGSLCEIHDLTFTQGSSSSLTLDKPAASVLVDASDVGYNYIDYAEAGRKIRFGRNDYNDLVIELSDDGNTLSWYSERYSSIFSGEFTVYLFPEENYHYIDGN